MRNEFLKTVSERTALALLVLSVAVINPKHMASASDIPTISFEELAEVCTEPDSAYKIRSNGQEIGDLSAAFDPRRPEQHGQLTAVLTPQRWDRVFLPQPVEIVYPSHNFATRLEIVTQTQPDTALVQLSLTETKTERTINEAQAKIPLNENPNETPITFCWTEGEIKFLKVDSEKHTENLVFTVEK